MHALGKNTRCTRTRSFSNPEDEEQVLQQLRYWLNSAKDYGTRLAHMSAKPASAALLASPDFNARLERERVADDYESLSEPEARPTPQNAATEGSGSSSSSSSTSSSSGSSS